MDLQNKIDSAKTRILELESLIEYWEKAKSRQEEKNKVEQNIQNSIQMTVSKTKVKAQVKSRWYYYFWGTATIAVVTGQVYVGNGFRRMAESFDESLKTPLLITIPQLEDSPSYESPKNSGGYPVIPDRKILGQMEIEG